MTPGIGVATLARVALAVALGTMADHAMAETVQRMATANPPLDTTDWKAVELAGKPVPPAERESRGAGGVRGARSHAGGYEVTGVAGDRVAARDVRGKR
jgi:hypothetical protein